MRIVLFTGKGGVGKTTTAAATAVRAARSGVRTLVLSTDAAHSLGDALDRDLRAVDHSHSHSHSHRHGDGDGQVGAPDPVCVEPGLHALQVSAPHTVDRSWRVVQDYLLQLLGTLGIDTVVAEELTSLPGAEEVAALLELRARAQSGQWDLVVVDCAPTAETLRLLALPEALAWHLERLLPGQRGLLRSLRPAAAAAAGVPLPSPEVAATVRGWYRQMRDVHTLLTTDRSSVRLVLTPERVVIAEARRMWTSLSLYGFVVDGVVVNRLIPVGNHKADEADAGDQADQADQADSWQRAWNTAQAAGLAEVERSFGGVPIATAPYLAHEPIGPDALAALADQTSGIDTLGPDQLLEAVRRPGLTVSRTTRGYELRLPLPLVTASEVDLKRRGTELLVAVGDHRRVLSLPSALQRCVVRGAGVRDGTLRVAFQPDPDQWRTPSVDGRDGPDHEPDEPSDAVTQEVAR
ncbi:ArsA family ATPase [Lapillicoccus sp.]|uniref:ArsA family ATPase n=1 Tax=Lapillicoccus sp. TaxID=1909287 RepID=UPI0032648988